VLTGLVLAEQRAKARFTEIMWQSLCLVEDEEETLFAFVSWFSFKFYLGFLLIRTNLIHTWNMLASGYSCRTSSSLWL